MAIEHYTDFDLGFAKIEESACHLLAIYFADKNIHTLLAKYSYPGIENYYNETKDDVITHQLIQIATLYRMQIWKIDDEYRLKEKDKEVGLLYVDKSSDGIPLSMYEACNKIIHADRVYFESRKVRKMPFYYLREWVTIKGQKGKQKWEANINIVFFCDWALRAPSKTTIEWDKYPGIQSPKINALFDQINDEFTKQIENNSNQKLESAVKTPAE